MSVGLEVRDLGILGGETTAFCVGGGDHKGISRPSSTDNGSGPRVLSHAKPSIVSNIE